MGKCSRFLHLNKIVYGKNYIAKLEYKGKLKKVYRGLFMNTVMIILVGFGLAFDVFYIAVSQGCVLDRIQGKNMSLMCLIVCGWQMVALAIGYGIARLLKVYAMSTEIRMVWSLISALIFIAIGFIKIYISNHKVARPEIRQEIDFKKICGIASSTSVYTLFAGLACEWIGMDIADICIMVCFMTITLVISGVYVGYRNGELNNKVYLSGGALLIIAGLCVIAEYLIWWFGR